MYELFTTDLRQTVSAIDCPVVLLGAWIAYKNYEVTRESALKGYESQVAAIKNCKEIVKWNYPIQPKTLYILR